LVQYSYSNEIPVVIGYDANSHHIAWGCDSLITNCRGAAVLEYIASSMLEISNRGSEPTFATRVRDYIVFGQYIAGNGRLQKRTTE
jgi:hypothetical protein